MRANVHDYSKRDELFQPRVVLYRLQRIQRLMPLCLRAPRCTGNSSDGASEREPLVTALQTQRTTPGSKKNIEDGLLIHQT